MTKPLVRGLLWAVAGYPLGALAGYFAVQWLSSNSHDRSVEAAMTAVFVAGPLLAVIAFGAGFARAVRERRSGPEE
jgi:prepilin signal peptidase PulO-like enzyme (type II secretory pathway)